MTLPILNHLRHDHDGVTTVEFALVMPVLLMMILGLFDLGHNMYTSTMLQGAVQQSARNSTIEGAASNAVALDGNVTRAVRAISPNSTLQFSRMAYASFSGVNTAEDFSDLNGNGVCDSNEPFEDANNNSNWDSDRGMAGMGGARDAVLYKVTVTYPRLLPIARFIPGQTDNFTMESNTVLRNQPYGMQGELATTTSNCI